MHGASEAFGPDQVGAIPAGRRLSMIFGVVGLISLAAAFAMGLAEGNRVVFFRGYLVNLMYFLSIALGGLFFVLIMHLTRAGWSVVLRRIAEVTAAATLPLTILVLPVLFGIHDLYEWSHTEVVAGDELLTHKVPFLNTTFFIVRVLFYFAVWNIISSYFLRRSIAQDGSGDPQITVRLEKVAAPSMILYALTLTFASFDLMMTLNPHWYSTIYGVYYFAGSVLAYFSLVPLLVHFLQSRGQLTRVVTTGHLHDMGKLMFAFVVFWAYIAFSQYFLIWYGNIPEETIFYELRQESPWVGLSLLLLFGHFVVPFLFLLSRHPKRKRFTLLTAAVWLLFVHWFDLYYLIIPGTREAGGLLSLLDLLSFVGIGGLFFAALFWKLGRVNLIPVRDPRLSESLGFENV